MRLNSAEDLTDDQIRNFWAKVIPQRNGCWDWVGTTSAGGYGLWTVQVNKEKRTALTHRLAYELLDDPIPEGQIMRHLCHNTRCCNPSHLAPGTHKDNAKDRRIKEGRTKGYDVDIDGKLTDPLMGRKMESRLRAVQRGLRYGKTLGQIAAELGVCKATVRRAKRMLGSIQTSA